MGQYTLDLPRRQLLDPVGKDVALTSGEFDILKTFAENPNRPLSRDWLLETTSHRSRDPFDRAIDLLAGECDCQFPGHRCQPGHLSLLG